MAEETNESILVRDKHGRRSVSKLVRVQEQGFSKGFLELHNPSPLLLLLMLSSWARYTNLRCLYVTLFA